MQATDGFSLEVTTVSMRPVLPLPDSSRQRVTVSGSEFDEMKIAQESYLRRLAYKNTTLKIDESFFNDFDMKSGYFLVVVYEKSSGTPLLSARYYFDVSVITTYLAGDTPVEPNSNKVMKSLKIDNFEKSKLVLADRLSGNISNSLYRRYRSAIFFLLYDEIVKTNKDSHLLLMVKKEKNHKQISRYLEMGFNLIGSTWHKGKEHAIIQCDLKSATGWRKK